MHLPFITTGYFITTTSYTNYLWKAKMYHLAAILKKLLTILLLFFISGHTTGYFHDTYHEMKMTQGMDDNKEKTGSEEKKDEMKYDVLTSPELFKTVVKQTFGALPLLQTPSPVIDLLAPPPDQPLRF